MNFEGSQEAKPPSCAQADLRLRYAHMQSGRKFCVSAQFIYQESNMTEIISVDQHDSYCVRIIMCIDRDKHHENIPI